MSESTRDKGANLFSAIALAALGPVEIHTTSHACLGLMLRNHQGFVMALIRGFQYHTAIIRTVNLTPARLADALRLRAIRMPKAKKPQLRVLLIC